MMKFKKTSIILLFITFILCGCSKDSISEDKEKYLELTKKAEKIEEYSEEYFESAETQAELNRESYNVYNKWEALMGEAYEYLKSTKSESDFSAIEEEQDEWIKEREEGILKAAEEWKGGSGEPMAKNSAAIIYTRERCYSLISLLNN